MIPLPLKIKTRYNAHTGKQRRASEEEEGPQKKSLKQEGPNASLDLWGGRMESLQFLLTAATETIFTFTASFVILFMRFSTKPYWSVVKTSRLLRDHRISTTALVAFSFFVFAVALGGTGDSILSFNVAFGLQKIWQLDKKQVELLYLFLFILGSTVATILSGRLFSNLLTINRINRRLFSDIYNVFISFIILWFISLAVLSAYFFKLIHADSWLGSFKLKLAVSYFLKLIDISDISEMVVSPAFYVILLMSGYFGFRMVRSWNLRRSILRLVRSKNSREPLPRTVIALSTTITAFAVILIPGLYLALLSSSLFKHASPTDDFRFLASCFFSGQNTDQKLHVSLIAKNISGKNVYMSALYITFLTKEESLTASKLQATGLRIDPKDIFWMSPKGLYFDPEETRYYRLEVAPTASLPSFNECSADSKLPDPDAKITFVTGKTQGDSHAVSATVGELK